MKTLATVILIGLIGISSGCKNNQSSDQSSDQSTSETTQSANSQTTDPRDTTTAPKPMDHPTPGVESGDGGQVP
ncbi:MAG: hypothetical protein EOO48_07330 [Flavobacterium sp.]|nr:MAG: hypothetical protein EOO48_07330 [Flavobacterium sp.]